MKREIPVFCNQCKGVDILDLNQYAKFVARKWDLIWQNMPVEERRKAAASKIVGPIDLVVNVKKLGKVIREHGSVDYGCRRCVAIAVDNWYKRKGYNSVRYGNIVVDINYYEQHQKEVSALVAEMKTR